MDQATMRAWSWHKQGLDGSLQGKSSAEVFTTAGWARSAGSANPYLTVFSRAGISREQLDSDVAALKVHELPTARGCTYVLGAGDFAWALTLGLAAAEVPVKVLDKLEVPRSELAALEEAVLIVLGDGVERDPAQLKAQLGSAVRALGEEGKKRGVSTTLPAVLGKLQAQGRIRRVPVNGRLDQQRYAYTAWGLEPSALTPEQVRARLMERYLGWCGGATLKQTQWFTAFTVAHTKAALADVGAIESEGLWILPADADARENFTAPKKEQIQLLTGADSLFLLRRNSADYLAARNTAQLEFSTNFVLQADLPDHPILDRGQIIGLWQYDRGEQRIAHRMFGAPSKAVNHRISEVETFIREDLGDVKSLSQESPGGRQKRIDALNAAH